VVLMSQRVRVRTGNESLCLLAVCCCESGKAFTPRGWVVFDAGQGSETHAPRSSVDGSTRGR